MLFNRIKEIVKEVKEAFGRYDTPSEADLISQSLDYLDTRGMNVCENAMDELKFTIWLRDKVKKSAYKSEDKLVDYSLKEFK